MTPSAPPAPGLPPVVSQQIETPPPHARGWVHTIAPAFLGLVTWFPLLDALGGIGGGSDVFGRWLTSLLALGAFHLLVYLPLAGLGLRTRGRLPVVTANALGATGAEWIAGVLYGLFAATWGSVAIWFSVRMTLDGLTALGLLAPQGDALHRVLNVPMESPLIIVALAWWSFIIVSANGLNLMGAIAAMMRVYSPFAGLLIVATAAGFWWFGSLPERAPSATALPDLRTFQFLFGAFAFAGVMAVEWGGSVRDRRDVRQGGWLAILAAGAATTLAGLTLGSFGPAGSAWSALIATASGGETTTRWACGALLLLFGLASLAPACYASSLFASRFRAHWPGMGTWPGVGLSFLLFVVPGATGFARDVESLALVSGGLFAPLAGILATESVMGRRGQVEGTGWNPVGVVAWVAGAVIGLAPIVPALRSFQPAALFGWAVAAVAYAILSRRPAGASS